MVRNPDDEGAVVGVEGPIRVVIVDDQKLFTRGLSGIVDLQPDMEVVGEAHNGEEAVELCRETEPDVVLMDISMPVMDGVTATRRIRDLLPATGILILTAHEQNEYIYEGIKAGAQGYLLKDCDPDSLVHAIQAVYTGHTIMAPNVAQKMLQTFGGAGTPGSRLAPPLTPRELEVIRALAHGKSDRQIAQSLQISEKTVRNHTSSIYRKLHIFDRTQAVIYAIREGVIDVEDLEYRPEPGPST